jgi:hypothetical protein
MKKGKQVWIPLVIIVLIVLNLFTAYQYSTLAQKLDDRKVQDFAGTYQFAQEQTYLAITTEEVEKTFAIYDQSSKRMASGTYEAVDENGISLHVDGKPYAALIYSNEKFYYVDENHEMTVVNKLMDSAIDNTEGGSTS